MPCKLPHREFFMGECDLGDRLKKITGQRQERLTAYAADETSTTLATRLARAITAFLS